MSKAPFEFVLEELTTVPIHTKPMFGCLAIYREEYLLLILRDKPDYTRDNGVWLALQPEHYESIKKEFPLLRSVELLGSKTPTVWQNIPKEDDDFEAAALKVCELIRKGDKRIGKIPKKKSKPKSH